MLAQLYQVMPEAGDLPRPKLAFFFDEAHLLFRDATKELIQKVEQVVRLIRSKGVGIYFVTQSPTDVPDSVLSQLGNRVQHALRSYTPADQKAVRAAAASFRANPNLNVAKAIQELAVGEALVSTLDENGAPTPVARTKVRPPNSQVGALLLATRQEIIASSDLGAAYAQTVDRESAFEILSGRAKAAAASEAAASTQAAANKAATKAPKQKPARAPTAAAKPRASATAAEAENSGTLLHTVARELMRGIMGTGSPRRRRR